MGLDESWLPLFCKGDHAKHKANISPGRPGAGCTHPGLDAGPEDAASSRRRQRILNPEPCPTKLRPTLDWMPVRTTRLAVAADSAYTACDASRPSAWQVAAVA